ncbi:hypothetical protein PIB30_089603, partial [Stylosanthes scabra]|nr:hypothetical protein [Stylosanthes scabra]
PAPPTARRTARISVKYYSMKLADRGGPSIVAPTDNDPIEVSSNSDSEFKPTDTLGNLGEEDHEENPEEEQEEDSGEEMEENAEEEVEEEEVEEEYSDEDEYDQIYFEDYFELAPFNSSDESNAGPPPANH